MDQRHNCDAKKQKNTVRCGVLRGSEVSFVNSYKARRVLV